MSNKKVSVMAVSKKRSISPKSPRPTKRKNVSEIGSTKSPTSSRLLAAEKRKEVSVTRKREISSSSKPSSAKKRKKVSVTGSRKRPTSPKTPAGTRKKIAKNPIRSSNYEIYQPRETKRFPIQKVHELLEAAFPNGTVKVEAAVFLTGVLEYIATEIWELSETVAKSRSKGRAVKVTLEDMVNAISSDAEIMELIDNVRIGKQAEQIKGRTENRTKQTEYTEETKEHADEQMEHTEEGKEHTDERIESTEGKAVYEDKSIELPVIAKIMCC